jgi:hypothetical protein
MNADGSGQANRTNNLAVDDFPDWQPLPLTTPTFKNASEKCKALPGDYRNHGQCVKASK